MVAQPFPRAGAMQRPGNEQRLKEQAGEALAVGVEAEGVHPVEILRDVAGKDGDEERGGAQADGHAVPGKRDEARADEQLGHAGHDDDRIVRQRQ